MDPNNNQPLENTPIQQAAPAAVPVTAQSAAQPMPTRTSTPPKEKGNKVIILLVILLLLAVGIIVYVLFAKNQMNKAQETTSNNTVLVLPSPTAVPTLTPEEDLEVASPEADLLELEADAESL